MTTGTLVNGSIFGGGFNPGAYARLPVPPMPTIGMLSAAELTGTAAHHLPLATVHFSYMGTRAPSFGLTDWYYRMHIIPTLLTLGNVVSDETFIVGVWNAWLDRTQTLNSITETDFSGLLLTGQPDPPLLFRINEQRNYTLEIFTQGPPTIDAFATFVFADSESVSIEITGNRITAWALTPDWSNGISEKLGWKTEVMIAWSGTEQRRALRIAPRRIFKFDTFMQAADKQFVENSLFAWSAKVWALPIWPDGQRLSAPLTAGAFSITCDTVNRDFVAGGLGMLLTDARTFEVLQIDAVSSGSITLVHATGNNWAAGSKLYPVRAARMLTKPRLSRENGELALLQPEFTVVEPCDWPAASGLPMYRGVPVLENSQNTANTQEAGYERQAFILDNDTGSIDVIDTAEIGFSSRIHEWFLKGRTARSAFRSLLYLLKGRQGEMWVPSYEMDLTLLQDIGGGQSNIHCVFSGYTLYANTINRRDVRVELTNGTIYYRRITGATVENPQSELISLDSSLSFAAITRAQIRRISFMPLCRLDADEIDLQHLTAIDGLALSSTPFRAVNHDI